MLSSRLALTLKKNLLETKEGLLALIFPRLCGFCDAPEADPATALCPECYDALRPVEHPFCYQCGLPFPGVSPTGAPLCGKCLTTPPPYARARYGFRYDGGVREALVRFKYSGRLHLSRPLAALLVEAFGRHFHPEEFDLMLPVPLHRSRLLKRGFNQSLILAERVSQATGVPVDRTSFRKVRDTPPQVGLPRSERLRNIHQSFRVLRASAVRGKSVLVIDDVATTGSTIGEAAQTIMASGAKRVEALVLALRSRGAEFTPSSAGAMKEESKIS
jgi:ComF family protein